MFWIILWAGLLTFLIRRLLKLEIKEELNPLDEVTGPYQWPIVGNALIFLRSDSQDMFNYFRQFARDYKDRYVLKMFNRKVIHITSPEYAETVLGHSKNITKGKVYRFMQPWLGTGLLTSTGSKWHKRRKILTPTFHFNILRNFSSVMEEKSRNLVEKLKTSSGATLDVLPIISDFTLFTICETAMGTQLDSDKSAKTVEYKNAVKEMSTLILKRITTAWLHVEFLYKRSALAASSVVPLKKVHSFADEVIMERKNNKKQNVEQVLASEEIGTKKRLAMMDLLLEQEEKGEIDLEGIREEVHTFMFEGHDTTAMALTFAVMLLGQHPEVQERIFEETEAILLGSDRTPTLSDIGEMKYLEAVLKETLRLYPSVPFIARQITEDFKMGDIIVKKGTEAAVHIFDLHRRPEQFPDPDKFDPERFLTASSRHPYAYVPFSAGPRNCIGQRFAMIEMKFALSEICRTFRLEAASMEPPLLLSDMVLRPAGPINVKFLPR